jgi:hypothetical protein
VRASDLGLLGPTAVKCGELRVVCDATQINLSDFQAATTVKLLDGGPEKVQVYGLGANQTCSGPLSGALELRGVHHPPRDMPYLTSLALFRHLGPRGPRQIVDVGALAAGLPGSLLTELDLGKCPHLHPINPINPINPRNLADPLSLLPQAATRS